MKLRVLALVAFAALMVTACNKKVSTTTGTDTTAVVLDSLKADTTVTDSTKVDTAKVDTAKTK